MRDPACVSPGQPPAITPDGTSLQRSRTQIITVLSSVWSRAAARYPDISWDLDPDRHRAAFEQVLVEESGCSHALASALYAAMPTRWVAADGAVELLAALAARGLRLALLSNIAIDIRPRLNQLGMLELFDTVLLSYEVGLVKPDPRIFERAVQAIEVAPSECVMVGDSPITDGGAAAAGITALIIPVIDDRPQLAAVSRMLTTATG